MKNIKKKENKRKKKKKGFTLIELLAVIIILGVLMIIAIPSVTEYIQTSRKSAYIKTANQYISGARTEVNSAEIPMFDTNVTYYLPASCVSLEKGGDSPFGELEEAYIVVTYNGSGYDYYWTSRDTSNMGVLLTSEDLLADESILSGIDSINTSIGVGDREYILLIDSNCKGEGETKTAEVTIPEKSKADESIEDIAKPESELPMLNSITNIVANNDIPFFYPYIEQIKSITFETKIDIPEGAETYDFSSTKNGKVMSFLREHPTESGYYDLVIQGDGRIYANPDSSYLFSVFGEVTSINNIELLNTSMVTNMKGMFSHVPVYELDLSSWDTRKVTDMSEMFQYIGSHGIPNKSVKLTVGFDTSNVTNMERMFNTDGDNSPLMTLTLGSKFNTSKVTNMSYMFCGLGHNNKELKLYLGDKFDTSKVTNMSYMFTSLGYNAEEVILDIGDKFDTSLVVDMQSMFSDAGSHSLEFTLNLGDKFDTRNVNNMASMFSGTGRSNQNFTLNLGNKFDTSKVTNMKYMFYSTGYSSNVFKLDLGNKFNTSNVREMQYMFYRTGYSNPNFVLNLGDTFNSSNVTNMSHMFEEIAFSNDSFLLDCSNWNVEKVTQYFNFNKGADTKVIAPNWKK